MGYAVELLFDERSELAINKCIEKIQENNISNIFSELNNDPHLCLAVYDDNLDYPELLRQLETFPFKTFKLRLSNIGYFCSNDNTVFISPKVTNELLTLHTDYHQAFKQFDSSESSHYTLDNWVPHCTIADELTNADFTKTLQILKEEFRPMEVIVERIALVKFRPIEYLLVKETESFSA